MFHKYSLGGDTMAPIGLYARLCHAFLVKLKLAFLETTAKLCKHGSKFDDLDGPVGSRLQYFILILGQIGFDKKVGQFKVNSALQSF